MKRIFLVLVCLMTTGIARAEYGGGTHSAGGGRGGSSPVALGAAGTNPNLLQLNDPCEKFRPCSGPGCRRPSQPPYSTLPASMAGVPSIPAAQ